MSDKHFTLDIDPDGLRGVATHLATLKNHIHTKAGTVKGTPGEIGDSWTGDAATSIKAEMTGLGTLMDRYDDKLQPAIENLRSLAHDYDDALAQLPGLNHKWEQAETEYQSALDANQDHVAQTRQQWIDDGRTINMTLNHELDEMRSNGASAALSTKQSTQHGLEVSFGYTKMWLAQQTRALGSTLASAVPATIDPDALDAWQKGESETNPLAGLLGGLSLTSALKEAEHDDAVEEIQQQAEEDIEALQEALEDGDQEAIREAMDAIGDNADNPVYADHLVDTLGADGVKDLYLQIDDGLTSSDLVMEEIWPSLERLNDAIAHGVSRRSDEEMAAFIESFMESDYGPKMWALVASSEYADGRVNATAIAYHSEVYNGSLNDGMGMPGLFPQVFNYAYGDNDMLGQWDENSSGADLADILEHADPEHRDDLMFRLLNVQVDGGTMNDDDYQHIADLYGEMLVELKDRHLAALEHSAGARPDLLMEMLEHRYANASYSQYTDPIKPYLHALVNDPEWALWYMNNARDGFVPASTFKDLIDESGTDPEDLIAAMTTYQIQRGDDPDQVAVNLGLLMRQEDLLGDDIKWGGVLKSVAESLISAGAKTPLTGPALGVFNALLSEIQRLEQADKDLDSAMSKNAVQEIFAFGIYTQVHGGAPEGYTYERNGETVTVLGFDDYVAQEHLGDDDRAVNLYVQYLEESGGPTWREIDRLITKIDESRDEQ